MNCLMMKRTLSRAPSHAQQHRMYGIQLSPANFSQQMPMRASSNLLQQQPQLQKRCITITNECLNKKQIPLKIKEEIQAEQNAVLEEGAYLTRTLYRNCIRSIQSLRQNNQHDESVFHEIEARRKQQAEEHKNTDPAHKEFTRVVTHPVNRKMDLESRVNYYLNFVKENFVQERLFWNMRVLNRGSFATSDFDRYCERLKRGEHQRTFLLKDMKFPDPVPLSFDRERVKQFKKRGYAFVSFLENGKQKDKQEDDNEEKEDVDHDIMIRYNWSR